MSIPPYEARAQSLGLSPKEEVQKAAANPNATWVDVRTEEEVAQGCLHKLYNLPFVHHSCTVDSCEGLEQKAREHIKDKDGAWKDFTRRLKVNRADDVLSKSILVTNAYFSTHFVHTIYKSPFAAPVIVFCRSGRRATKPVQMLKDMGYKNVLNAGGFSDIDFLSK